MSAIFITDQTDSTALSGGTHSSPLLHARLAACTFGFELTSLSQSHFSCTLQVEAVITLLHHHQSGLVSAGIHLRMSASQSKAGTLQQKVEIHQHTPASVSLPTTCLPWQQIPQLEAYIQQPVDRSTSATRKQQGTHLQADAKHQNLSSNRQPPGMNVTDKELTYTRGSFHTLAPHCNVQYSTVLFICDRLSHDKYT